MGVNVEQFTDAQLQELYDIPRGLELDLRQKFIVNQAYEELIYLRKFRDDSQAENTRLVFQRRELQAKLDAINEEYKELKYRMESLEK